MSEEVTKADGREFRRGDRVVVTFPNNGDRVSGIVGRQDALGMIDVSTDNFGLVVVSSRVLLRPEIKVGSRVRSTHAFAIDGDWMLTGNVTNIYGNGLIRVLSPGVEESVDFAENWVAVA